MSKAANGEGSVFRRRGGGKKPWVAELTVGRAPSGRPRRTRRYAATRADANKILRELLRQRDKGQLSAKSRHTVATFVRHWIDDVKVHEVRATTVSGYDDLLQRYVLPRLGTVAMTDLQVQNIQHLLTHLRNEGLAPATIKQVRAILNGLCKHAVLTQVMAYNPVQATPSIKTTKSLDAQRTDIWTAEETRAALAAVRDTDVEVFLTLMLYTGMRPGEALGLLWEDVDMKSRTLVITGTLKQHRHVTPAGVGTVELVRNPPKTSASKRQLPIPQRLWVVLDRWQMHQDVMRITNVEKWTPTGYVLTSKYGTPLHAANLRRRLKRLLDKHGVRPVRMHSLRHFVARSALESDIPLEHVSQALGHTRIDTTKQIYAGYVQRLNDEFSVKLSEFVDTLTVARESADGIYDRGSAVPAVDIEVYPRE